MESPDSLSTPSLATVFFDKFEKEELQEILSSKPLDWLFAQAIVDEKVGKAPEFGNGLLSNIANPTLNETNNYVILIEKERPQGKKREDSFDLREMQQIIRELTVGIVVFDQLPGVCLRPKYDQGTFVDIPPAYIDTHVAQCMIELDYYMKCLWHGSHFGRERRQKFTERWTEIMNVNKDGLPETRVDKQAIFKDYGLYDFNKDPHWGGFYEEMADKCDEDVESCKKMNKEVLDSIGLYLLCCVEEAQQHKNLLAFSIKHDISAFTRKGLDRLMDDPHQPLTCWLQSQRKAVRDWFTKKPKVRQILAKVKFITALSYFLVSMKKFSMVPDINSYLPSLTSEQVKTEHTLPPLMLPTDNPCSNKLFANDDMYCHVHGALVIGKEPVTLKPASPALIESYDSILEVAVQQNHKKLKGSGDGNLYPMAEIDIDGKTYAMIAIELEKFYTQNPKSPRWLHTIIDGASQSRKRVFPVSESRINEGFNKRFGNAGKVVLSQLTLAVELGRSAVFQQIMTKSTKTRLSKCDDQMLSMMHYAAMNDHSNLICDMVRIWGCEVNNRAEGTGCYGPTPLHIATRSGALESVYCLLSYHADLSLTNKEGWLPIHEAAYRNQHIILDIFIRKRKDLVDAPTQNKDKATPLLLACSSGALDSVKRLLNAGAVPTNVDENNRGVIHLAALHRHVNILELFIEKSFESLAVWDLLVKMMDSHVNEEKYHSVVALETLTRGGKNWAQLLQAKAIPALVKLLKADPRLPPEEENSPARLELKTKTAAVICNISSQDEVRRAIAATNAIATFIGLLTLPHDVVQSHSAIIISDLSQVNDNAQKIAKEGAVAPLIALLKNWIPTVLTSAMCALCNLGENHAPNKDEIAKKGGLEPLVTLLDSSDRKVQAAAADALNVVCRENTSNQNFIISSGGIPPLVLLVQSNNIEVQVSAAGALRSMAQSNPESQERIAELGGVNPLIRLLKSNPRNLEVQEKASGALWALSGNDPSKRRDIGTKIGIEMLIVLLESRSEKIQFVAAKALSTLSCGAPKHQQKIREAGGVLPLVRMLKQAASERVLLAVISTLAALSIGLAHTPVKQNQTAIASGIKPLVALVTGQTEDCIKVQSAYALACIILAHPENQKLLEKESTFSYSLLIDLLYSADKEVSLGAGRALTTFAYNNIPAQRDIVNGGEIQYQQFLPFLVSDSEDERAHAAFQVVVLARVMTGEDHVVMMAKGIEILAELLDSTNDLVQELAANSLASLAHTRAGIPAAIVTVGAMQTLISLLFSTVELVRTSAATAIGYMTYNRDAMRQLLTACRRAPSLYQRLEEHCSGGKISPVFVKEWEYCKLVGLPSQAVKFYAEAIHDNPLPSQSTLIMAKTETVESPTFGTISEEIPDSSSINRYTSHSSALMPSG